MNYSAHMYIVLCFLTSYASGHVLFTNRLFVVVILLNYLARLHLSNILTSHLYEMLNKSAGFIIYLKYVNSNN